MSACYVSYSVLPCDTAPHDLVSQCPCPKEEIRSEKNHERQQAAEFLKIVMEVDP
jgi:hypothetical protein